MKKLKLDLDALQVESFQVSDKDLEQKGTVEGQSIYTANYCIFSPLCVGTWQAWCAGTIYV
jgi:hypothetical protein